MMVSSGDEAASPTSCQHLEQQYHRLVAEQAEWLAMYHLFVTHDWFQQCLKRLACQAARRYYLERQAADDIAQEVTLRWARRLRNRPDLGFDRERGSFCGWIFVLLRSDCRKVAYRWAKNRPSGRALATDTSRDPLFVQQMAIDFQQAIDQLPAVQQTILQLYLHGVTVHEIAAKMAYCPGHIYRILRKIQKMLAHVSHE